MPSEFYFLSPTTPEEMLTLINRLDSKKSCGHDDILVHTLKLSKYLLALLLPNVINESIYDGVFPDNLKNRWSSTNFLVER